MSDQNIIGMEPGVYPRMRALEYHALPHISRSHLEAGRQSMRHLLTRMQESEAQTPPMLIGRAVHAAVLEPDTFESTFIQMPDLNLRTKDGQAAKAALEAEYGAENLLRMGDYAMCVAMRDAVWAKASAAALLRSEGDAELSLVWDHEPTGIRCKSRWDRVSWKIAGGTIVDLKTTRAADQATFERDVFNMGYHRQGGFYRQAARARGIQMEHYCIIAVEKESPYEVAVYRIVEAALDAGWQECERVLGRVAECRESNVYPGYPDLVVDLTLPTWAWDKLQYQQGAY